MGRDMPHCFLVRVAIERNDRLFGAADGAADGELSADSADADSNGASADSELSADSSS